MKTRFSKLAALAGTLVLVLGLAACGSDDSAEAQKDETLTVFAAASLKSTFTELAEEFEKSHEGVEVRLSFGGSSDLAAQINEGAPADVFASADERTMALVADEGGTAKDPVIFATNVLEIATPVDNPAKVKSLEDLSNPEVKVVLCAPQVPCGAASQELLKKVGVTVKPVSEEQSVTDVLGKVTSGEADAGLVYVTDVISAGDTVNGIEIPEANEVVNLYPIAPLAKASDADLAQAFVDLITGSKGKDLLTKAGFGTP